jgi:hypothetical protein
MSESNKPGSTSKDKLIADLKQMLADTDALLQATTGLSLITHLTLPTILLV